MAAAAAASMATATAMAATTAAAVAPLRGSLRPESSGPHRGRAGARNAGLAWTNPPTWLPLPLREGGQWGTSGRSGAIPGNGNRLRVVAEAGKKDEQSGVLGFISKFKLVPDKKMAPVVLPIEKQFEEYHNTIEELKVFQRKTGQDFSQQIADLEEKLEKLMVETYERVTPVDRLSIARHPNRPTFLDHVHSITDRFVELHGDRGGYNDPAIVCGIGSIDGLSFMFIGHQKGRNTKENIARNFGMPTPNGYRKALRFMKHADHHGFPIITFIDTPGAHASLEAEELGQGEAIARNLRDMFDLRVPSISLVIGEGGSGGALAIGCCNKMLMLENSVYFVASPEACAAILWKTSAAAPKAATQMRITAPELLEIGIVDEVIPEPLGGAHKDPSQTSQSIKSVIMKHMHELLSMNEQDIMRQRWEKFRNIGGFLEGPKVSITKKFALKRRPKGFKSSPKPKILENPTKILIPLEDRSPKTNADGTLTHQTDNEENETGEQERENEAVSLPVSHYTA